MLKLSAERVVTFRQCHTPSKSVCLSSVQEAVSKPRGQICPRSTSTAYRFTVTKLKKFLTHTKKRERERERERERFDSPHP